VTECNRCGDCCEHLRLNFTKRALRRFLAAPHRSDPALDDHAATARFIVEHWHRVAGGGAATIFACDRFDPTTRLCTAHDDRPPICRGYPFYGAPPAVAVVQLSPRCSFNADKGVPVALR
jgi:Fe-S-cluster containining protein